MPLLIYALHLGIPIGTVTKPADHRTEEWFKISNKNFYPLKSVENSHQVHQVSC